MGAIGIAASLLAGTGALCQRAPSAPAMNTSQDHSILDPFVPASGRVLLPFRVTNGYILVDARVNGKRGVFMFDTGTPMTFEHQGKQYVALTVSAGGRSQLVVLALPATDQ
jgi:hypothetical protein